MGRQRRPLRQDGTPVSWGQVRQSGAQEGTQYQHEDLGGYGGDPKASGEGLEDLGQTQEEVRKLQRT